jgi:hypothetical protein
VSLFWRADFFCLKKARAMTGLIPTTPFGRRPVTLGQIAAGQWTRRVVEEAAKSGSNHPAAVNKWHLFRTLTEVRERLGVSDRSLSVLNALLSFHPETALTLPRRADACEAGGGEAAKRTHRPGAKADPARAKQDIRRRPGDRSGGEHFGEEAPNAEAPARKTSGAGTFGADPDIGCDLVVFPSNKALSQRAHGMAGTTLWRHLTALVAAGLIQRRDSPNGKRYARKGEGGEDRFSDAFGFDLTPLVARAPEFEALAEAARIERRQRTLRKERISLLRRDVGKLIGLGLDEGLAGDWEGLRLRAMALMRPLRSLRDDDDLAGLEAELAALREEAAKVLEIHVNSSNMQCNDHHNGMHQSNSNTQCHKDFEPTPKEEGQQAAVSAEATSEARITAASPDAGPSYPLGLILARISHRIEHTEAPESEKVVLHERLLHDSRRTPMATDCIRDSFGFEAVAGRNVVAAFDGGAITSDAGGLLLGAADRAILMVDRFAACFIDRRSQAHIEHSVATLLRQRIFAMALGYEDLNDHDTLRHDPVMAVLAGKLKARRADCAAVAGKSTLNRLELSTPEPSRYHKISYDAGAVDELFVDLFLEAHRTAPKQITLDLDATDDPLHGEQEGRFFHGYYKSYCYLPLYIFCGRHLLCARLRQANIDASAGAVEEVARIVARIRKSWPEIRILLRADSGFTRDDLMTWCEDNQVDYLFGLAKNARLVAEIAVELAEAQAENRRSGKPERRFKDFRYRTHKSWSRERRVVGKAEWIIPSAAERESETTPKPRRKTGNPKSIMAGDIDLAALDGRANPRFVVTSLPPDQHPARELYEKLYCARGEMENRIKECQLDLFADRTSAHTMRANQLRLWLASMAYVLISALRRIALVTTRLADATCGTIRLKLFKIGAQIRISVRRIKFSMASAFPYVDVFRSAWAALHGAAR